MKNVKTVFSLKSLQILTIFGFVLGSFLTPLNQINADVLPVSVAITASPGTIVVGQSSNLNWSSTDATNITITPNVGSVNPYGSMNVFPAQTTTYTIVGTNSTGGSATASATITVNQPQPIIPVSLSTPSISWTCNANQPVLSVSLPGGDVAGFDFDIDSNHNSYNGFYSGNAGQTRLFTGSIGGISFVQDGTYYFRTVSSNGMNHSDWIASTNTASCGGDVTLDCANGSSLTPMEFYNAYKSGKISANINVGSSQATANLVNNTACTAPVNLASYKMFDANNILSTQELFNSSGTQTLQRNSSKTLTVSLPSCKAQIDLYYSSGQAPVELDPSNPYTAPHDPFVITWAYKNAPLCTNTVLTPTVNLVANPSSITLGQSAALNWSSTNTTSCSLSQFGNVSLGGTRTVFPTQTTTYIITCVGTNGQSVNDSATVTVTSVVQPSGVLTLSPQHCTIAQSQSTCTVLANWNTQNATNPTLVDRNTGSTLSTLANGSKTVWVTFPQTIFDLKNNGTNLDTDTATASCASGTTWNGAICAQNAQNQPSVNLTAYPASITLGQSSTLSWTSTYTNSCSASWTGSVATSGSQSVSPTATSYYTITCYGTNGQSVTDNATVSVNSANDNVSVNIYADDTNIDYGDSTRVRWTSSNADYCTASNGTNGWSGNRGTSGSFQTGSLYGDTTYRINCYNGNDSDTASVTVYVDSYNNQTCRDSSAINYGGTLPCRYNYTNPTCQDPYAINYRGAFPCVYNNIINNQPTVVIYSDKSSVSYNGSATIRWISTNATSCFASGGSTGWAGAKSIGPGIFYTGSLTGSRTYSITCTSNFGTASDSVTVSVGGQVLGTSTTRPAPTSLVIITSSVDRNQPIVPTLDNTRPHPGDEINYTVTYQNIGTGSVKNLVLRLDLPYEVSYMFSNPSNPTVSGNTLIFNLGTLKANSQGTVTVRVRVQDNVAPGTVLNFPAVLSYVDPSGYPQTVTANISAQVWTPSQEINTDNQKNQDSDVKLGANVFGAGFWPESLFGWLLLLVLVLLLVFLARYLFGQQRQPTYLLPPSPAPRRTTTTVVEH